MKGIPLVLTLTSVTGYESRMLEAAIDIVPPIRQCWRRPGKRPDWLHADQTYAYRRCRQVLTHRRIQHRIARREIEISQRLGRHRRVFDPSTRAG